MNRFPEQGQLSHCQAPVRVRSKQGSRGWVAARPGNLPTHRCPPPLQGNAHAFIVHLVAAAQAVAFERFHGGSSTTERNAGKTRLVAAGELAVVRAGRPGAGLRPSTLGASSRRTCRTRHRSKTEPGRYSSSTMGASRSFFISSASLTASVCSLSGRHLLEAA